jgi:hypothetical protein
MGGGYETAPPRQIFLKPLTPPPLGILAKTSRTPSPGFSTRVHLWYVRNYQQQNRIL